MPLKHLFYYFSFLFFPMVLTNCISKTKSIVFDPEHNLALDVYAPKKQKAGTEVLLFVHGGNWRSGKRSRYKFFGKGFAKKGVVTVVLDYRLSDRTTYKGMAADVAKAAQWVKENISKFGGDPDKIFLSGHSSGAHLASLVATDPKYFEELKMNDPLKGVVLIDPFGLNMYTYLKNSQNKEDSIYFPAFTKDPQNWKDGSPLYHLGKNSPRHILFVGEKTYPVIKIYSREFLMALKPFQPEIQLVEVKGKKHVPMIAQFYNPWNKRYGEILKFIKEK